MNDSIMKAEVMASCEVSPRPKGLAAPLGRICMLLLLMLFLKNLQDFRGTDFLDFPQFYFYQALYFSGVLAFAASCLLTYKLHLTSWWA